MAIFCIILPYLLVILQDAVEVASDDLSSLSAHVLHLEEMMSNLQTQAQTQEQKQAAVLSNVLSELSTLRKDYNSLQTELATVKTQLQTNEDELLQLKDDFQSCEANLTSLKNEVSIMKSDWNSSKVSDDTMIKETKTSIRKLKVEVEHLKTTVNSTNKDVKTVQSHVEYLLKNQTDMESELIGISSEHQNLSTEVSNINNGVELLSSNISYFQEEHEMNMNTLKHVTDKLSKRILFTARVDQNPLAIPGVGITIKFAEVITNVGGGYNPNTGVFHTPVAGDYLFVLQILDPPSKEVNLQIKANGTVAATLYVYAGIFHDMSSVSALIHLDEWEEVHVESSFCAECSIRGKEWSQFAGMLLRAD